MTAVMLGVEVQIWARPLILLYLYSEGRELYLWSSGEMTSKSVDDGCHHGEWAEYVIHLLGKCFELQMRSYPLQLMVDRISDGVLTKQTIVKRKYAHFISAAHAIVGQEKGIEQT
eukprot:scaffold389_cov62-Cyclotella_meneghiniana.AAC.3